MRRLDVGGRRDRPIEGRCRSRSTAGSCPGSRATRWRPRCSRTAWTWCVARRSRDVPAACTRPGAEEPCAFVGVDAPFVDPVVAATTVDLVEGLVAHGVPGVGRLPDEGVPTVRSEHRHAHVETLVIGASIGRRHRGERRRRARRSFDAGRVARLAARRCLAGRRRARARDRARRLRGRLRADPSAVPPGRARLARARPQRGARDRSARTADRVRRQRPARRDAGHVRPDVPRSLRRGTGQPSGRVHDEPPRSRRGVRTGGRGSRDRGDRGRRDGRRPGDRRRASARDRRPRRMGGRGDRGRPARLRRAPGGSGRRAGHDRRRPAARLRRMEPGRPALARDRRRPPLRRAARVLRPGRDRTALALGRGRRRRRCPDVRAVLVRAGGRLLATLRGHAARPDGGRRARRRGARPPLGRAHQARDVHRHGAGSGSDVGRADGRDREPGARRRTGRAGPDERPSAVHAGLVRGARGRRPRAPVRSGARDADPSRGTSTAARRSRTSGSGSVRGTSLRTRPSRWRPRSCAKGWRSGPASA